MSKAGMGFRLTLAPFNAIGTVGGSVRLSAHPGEEGISSRAEFDALIEKLECIRDEVCRLNNWDGAWAVGWPVDHKDTPCVEE